MTTTTAATTATYTSTTDGAQTVSSGQIVSGGHSDDLWDHLVDIESFFAAHGFRRIQRPLRSHVVPCTPCTVYKEENRCLQFISFNRWSDLPSYRLAYPLVLIATFELRALCVHCQKKETMDANKNNTTFSLMWHKEMLHSANEKCISRDATETYIKIHFTIVVCFKTHTRTSIVKCSNSLYDAFCFKTHTRTSIVKWIRILEGIDLCSF